MEASATEKQEIDSSTIESSDNKEGEIVTSKQRLNLEKENLIVNNFVCFFEPLIQNLDKNVDSLRYYFLIHVNNLINVLYWI